MDQFRPCAHNCCQFRDLITTVKSLQIPMCNMNILVILINQCPNIFFKFKHSLDMTKNANKYREKETTVISLLRLLINKKFIFRIFELTNQFCGQCFNSFLIVLYLSNTTNSASSEYLFQNVCMYSQ